MPPLREWPKWILYFLIGGIRGLLTKPKRSK